MAARQQGLLVDVPAAPALSSTKDGKSPARSPGLSPGSALSPGPMGAARTSSTGSGRMGPMSPGTAQERRNTLNSVHSQGSSKALTSPKVTEVVHTVAGKRVSLDTLHSYTVADARHLLRKTLIDVDAKQEELRELVSVRYKDFIDSADTISGMGASGKSIIQTAGKLGECCNSLVSGTWKSAPKPADQKADCARNLMKVLKAPESIAKEIENRSYLQGAAQLMQARRAYQAAARSGLPDVDRWLSLPYVRQRVRTLMGQRLTESIVNSCQSFLRQTTEGETTVSDIGDAMAAMTLVKEFSLYDCLDAYLEARSICIKSICEEVRALEQQDNDDVALHNMLKKACQVLAQGACAVIQLFHKFSEETDPLLASKLKEISGLNIRPDVVEALPLEHCQSSSLAWVKSMAAAIKAATGAALHNINSGATLATLEHALRQFSQEVVSGAEESQCWSLVTDQTLWSLLFSGSFTLRSNQLVEARFAAIQVDSFLNKDLQVVLDRQPESSGLKKTSTLHLFEARRPQAHGQAANLMAESEEMPWDNQCNKSAAYFLLQLHSALRDCKLLVEADQDAKGIGERAALLANSAKKSVGMVAQQLLTKAQTLRGKVDALVQPGVMAAGRGGIPSEVSVDHALYIAQCATGVRLHLPGLLAMLPIGQSGEKKHAEEDNQKLLALLEQAANVGHGTWVEWVALHTSRQFEGALYELITMSKGQLKHDIKKFWEEQEVSIEAETGDIKTDKVMIPSSLMTHTYNLLFSASVAIHEVQDPPLQQGTLQTLVSCLVSSLVIGYEGLPDQDLEGGEAVCIQLYFDFGVALEVLAGYSAGPVGSSSGSMAQRIRNVKSRLQDYLDPIDWSFQQPLVAANVAKAYQRCTVVFGSMVHLKRKEDISSASSQYTSLPKPLNLLPLATHQVRFGYLPAVDNWSVATAGEEGEEDAYGDLLEAGNSSLSPGPSGSGVGKAMESIHRDVQASLSSMSSLQSFGSFFGQKVYQGWGNTT